MKFVYSGGGGGLRGGHINDEAVLAGNDGGFERVVLVLCHG